VDRSASIIGQNENSPTKLAASSAIADLFSGAVFGDMMDVMPMVGILVRQEGAFIGAVYGLIFLRINSS
jgi:hypothetical protein